MYRSAIRASARATTRQATLHSTPRRFAGRLSVPPADGPRSWKNSLARLGLAAGGIWYYSTSDVFADSGATYSSARLPIAEADDENFPTVEAIAAARKARQSSASTSSSPSPISAKPSSEAQAVAATSADPLEAPESGSPEDLEEEAAQQGAFNEETGEINWDCPCLGGMAHGPCGPEFREAFSCFVFSKDEPKGIDCIDKFKGMQDCFRAHPDVYGAELSDEEDEIEQSQALPASSSTSFDSSFESDPAKSSDAPFPVATHHDPSHGDAVPKAAFSATTAETGDGLPPGATKYESEEDRTKRAKAAKAQVEKDHGGKEADSHAQGKGHRSEDGKDMRTAAQHGLSGNSDDRDAPKKGGW